MDIGELFLQQPNAGLDIAAGGVESAPRSSGKAQQLEAAARQFEGVFIQQILKQMQETIEESSFDPEDSSNGQVHGMYCTFLADAISQRGGVGLWEQIYDQLNRLTESPDGGAINMGA
ncbi:MAG: rod-binding protein [Planctomycetaceae bacterium]|nr:rod-binding protein [Planctomycetaceae bacterium]